jgi:alpha-galactosidase
MLEVGTDVLTSAEEQTHFSMWAILKSPLTIGGALKDDLVSISEDSLAILKNEDVIAFNQDSLGLSASLRRRWTEEGYEVWSGDLEDTRVVAALINWDDVEKDLTIDLPDVGVQYAGSIKDVWAGQAVGGVRTSYTSTVAAHGVMLLELNNVTQAGVYSAELFATKSGYVPSYPYCPRFFIRSHVPVVVFPWSAANQACLETSYPLATYTPTPRARTTPFPSLSPVPQTPIPTFP